MSLTKPNQTARRVVLHFTLFRHLSSNCTPPAVWGPKQKHPSGWQRPWQQVGEGKPRYLRQSDVSGGQVWMCHVGGKCFGNSLCGVSYESNLHLKVWNMLDDVGRKGLLQLFSYGRCVNLEPTVTNIEPQQHLTRNKEPRTNSLQRIFKQRFIILNCNRIGSANLSKCNHGTQDTVNLSTSHTFCHFQSVSCVESGKENFNCDCYPSHIYPSHLTDFEFLYI